MPTRPIIGIHAAAHVASGSPPNPKVRYQLRAEAHLIQQARAADPLKITYDWTDSTGEHRQSNVFATTGDWRLATGQNVRTHWVEFEPIRDQRLE